MAQDPFEPYLEQADDLFAAGDVVKAGQIWQAILKRVPQHPEAKAGLARVKLHFGVRATQEEARNTQSRPAPAPQPQASALLDQGTALYDGGQVEEALAIWVHLLVLDPHHVLARGYANMARSLLGMPLLEPPPQEPAPPVPSIHDIPPGSTIALPVRDGFPTVPVPEPPPEPEDDETLLRNGCLLFDMGQTEDALQRWERLLARNPHHTQAREYVRQVRAQLGLPPLASAEAPAAAAPVSPTVPATHGGEDASDRQDRLVREGVQLFDMGMTEEAVAKWEAVLAEAPDHADAQGYLAMARREPISPTGRASAPPPPPPAPEPPPAPVEVLPPTRAERRRDIQNTLAQADRLLQLQRFDEALQLYDRILEAEPSHAGALQGYQQARAFAQAAAQPEPPPMPEPEALVAPEPAPPLPPLALPETTQTERTSLVRGGLEPPELLKRLQLPEWALAPRLWMLVAGGLTVTLVSFFLIRSHLKEAKLRVDVSAAKQEALAHALRATQVPDLQEPADKVLKDAEALVQTQPLMGYLRAQAFMAVQPDHPAGLALQERARTLLASSPAPTGTLPDVDRLVKEGNLEAAQQLLLALLRQTPDDADLRQRTFRLTGHLVQLHATKEQWDQAREGLQLMRALAPADRSIPGRLRLLEALPSLPKNERSYWIPLLG